MLKFVWSELFVLNAAQSNMQLQSLVQAISVQHHTHDHVFHLMDHIKVFQEQVERLKGLNIDRAEYSCLKAIVLLTPGE